MFVNQHLVTKSYRQQFKLQARRTGAKDRIDAAQDKRDRKNVKRAEIARRNAA